MASATQTHEWTVDVATVLEEVANSLERESGEVVSRDGAYAADVVDQLVASAIELRSQVDAYLGRTRTDPVAAKLLEFADRFVNRYPSNIAHSGANVARILREEAAKL